MTARELIKARRLTFLHPDVVSKADDENIAAILKAVAYYRNIPIFKVFYSLLHKSDRLSLEQYRGIYNMLADYKSFHPADYFLVGFSDAIIKSNVVNHGVKSLYAIMVYNQLHKSNRRFDKSIDKTGRALEKAIANYYRLDKAINLAIISKSKVLKVNNRNIVKVVSRLS